MTQPQTKSMIIEAMDDEGKGLARLGKLSVIDNDGDTYQEGAFAWKDGDGQWCSMLPAHNRTKMPFGKARVYEDGDQLMAELHLNLKTQAGREWHAALKFDLDQGKSVQEWSYGYTAKKFIYQLVKGQQVRVLTQVAVHEVSPVLKAAGIDTGTIQLKNAEFKADRFTALLDELAMMTKAISDDPQVLSATGIKQLGDIHGQLGLSIAAIKGDEGDKDSDNDGMAENAALAGFLAVQAKQHLREGERKA